MDCVLVKTEAGLEGLGERAKRAYDRWRDAVKSLEVGETVRFSWHEPRNPKFHAKHMVMLSKIFEAQEQFQDPDALRMWVQVGAGHCDLVPGPTGKPVAIPRSIAFEKMDEAEFGEHHEAAKAFLRSAHATRFLWPLMTDIAADTRMNELLERFEQ